MSAPLRSRYAPALVNIEITAGIEAPPLPLMNQQSRRTIPDSISFGGVEIIANGSLAPDVWAIVDRNRREIVDRVGVRVSQVTAPALPVRAPVKPPLQPGAPAPGKRKINLETE